MGLFDAFKKTPAADQEPAVAGIGAGAGIDFMAAIEAHVSWKIRLEQYIDGTATEKLDPDVIGMDDQCPLGKWIYGAGQKYSANPLFEEVREAHAKFHKCSADIIRQADAGDKAGAIDALHHGDHFRHSQRIKAKLARMHVELKDMEP